MCTTIWKKKYCHWLQHGKNTDLHVNILLTHLVPAAVFSILFYLFFTDKKKKFKQLGSFPQDTRDDQSNEKKKNREKEECGELLVSAPRSQQVSIKTKLTADFLVFTVASKSWNIMQSYSRAAIRIHTGLGLLMTTLKIAVYKMFGVFY